VALQDNGVSIKRGSWLKNQGLDRFDDDTVAWSGFERLPDIETRDGDLFYRVQGDERPEQIASRFYGKGEMWWIIALANGIRIPISDIYSGRLLRIPDPSEMLRQVRELELLRG
jgi:nucleoid-associated protein YgaU